MIISKLFKQSEQKDKRVKLSSKKMLNKLGKIFFEWMLTREEISLTYKIVTGRPGAPTTIVSKCGRYKLEIKSRKILRIYLQNLNDGVIYYYNVKIKKLWQSRVKDQIAEAMLMQAGKIELFGRSILENYPNNM